MKKCFLFEGVGVGDLDEFFFHFIRDFEFRELSIFLSKKSSYNIPRSISQDSKGDRYILDQLNTTHSNIIVYQKFKAKGILPDITAGHSLGVYSALYAAGALNLADTVQLVSDMHRIMKDAFKDTDFLSAVIIAPSIQNLRQVLISKSKTDKPIYISNINTAKQAVVCGPRESVISLFAYYHDLSKLKEKQLDIPYPVHTPYISAIREKLAGAVDGLALKDPLIPVINTVNQSFMTKKDELAEYIVSNLCNPVHWLNTVEYNKEEMIFYDIGLRYYISQLMFWIDKKTKCFNLRKNIERNSVING